MREYRKRPDIQMAQRLGITPKAAREIIERRDR